MKVSLSIIVFLLSLVFTNPGFAARETLRCGSKIISTGMTMDEILDYCGEPQNMETEEIPVRSRNRVIGQTLKHTLTYHRPGGKPAVLTFDQDKLVSIDYP